MTGLTCEEVRDRLALHVDGALDAPETEAVRGHLAACEACRREERLERAAVAALEGIPPLAAPEGFAARVAAAARPRPRGLRWIPLAAGIAGVAVAGALWIAQSWPEKSADEEVIAHLDLLENWDVVTDEDLALALDAPEEDLGLLQGALGG